MPSGTHKGLDPPEDPTDPRRNDEVYERRDGAINDVIRLIRCGGSKSIIYVSR